MNPYNRIGEGFTMAICVYKVQSTLSQVTQDHIHDYLHAIEAELGDELRMVSMEEFAQQDFGLVFVASGGSEGIFLSQYEQISDKPVYILTSGESNSLAASMEILSYLHQHGKAGEIIHGSLSHVAQRIRALQRSTAALKQLNGAVMGVIGAPSDWLIASSDDDAAYRAKLGLSLKHIPIEELIEEANKGGYPENEWTRQLKGKGWDAAEMEKALNVYGALKRIVEKYGLSGVTVRCFDLLGTVKTTGCLGLAILNAEGICAGCEGDVPSLISMAILHAVSGQPVFLCNPSRIDTASGTMVLAHCTLPINMPSDYILKTHYESDIGVALAATIPEETCTIFKTSNDLNRHFAKAGKIVENLHEDCLCRTQIRLALDDFSYFLTRPINNHHLVCLGDHTAALEQFFAQIG